MKIYIAGKITGDENYKQKFENAELALAGHTIISPTILPEGLAQSDYMRICLAMIDCADMVAFLPDWEDSEGAKLEYAYCHKIGKQYYYI